MLPPETAHTLTLSSLQKVYQWKLSPWLFGKPVSVPRTVMGLHFPNPVGLAAGLDKNADYIDCLASLGFGFIEVGTVTPQPQGGHPKPRLFRLPQAEALINRMGFNNLGVDHLVNQVKKRHFPGILGINIGKNASTPPELTVSDYLISFFKVYPYADYVTLNISSPNTEKLRQWQQGQYLTNLLSALKQAQEQLHEQYRRYVPIAVKIAPDLTEEEIAVMVDKLLEYQLDGVIATNTTLSRISVQHLRHGQEAGGLSGAPLFPASTQIIKRLHELLQGRLPIIASGGIMSVQDAQKKLAAGASLVQLYSGLIYRGPFLVREIARSLSS